MNESHRLLATSATNKVELPPDQIHAPGSPRVLIVVAQLRDEERKDQDRITDLSPRPFVVEALISRIPPASPDLNGAFTSVDGGSLVQLPVGIQGLHINTSYGAFEIELNDSGELSLLRMRLDAESATVARNKANDAMAAFLDHLAYLAGASILTGLTRTYDERNQVTTLDWVGPDRSVVLNPGAQQLQEELAPIYALYREFKNANSAFYRLLCLCKILEGIFKSLRPAANQRARELGINIPQLKEKVPAHADIAAHLRPYVGTPINVFFDKVLQKEYRNIVAHFMLDGGAPLHASSASERQRFAEMAFVCDLCVRIVIANHETFLRRVNEALFATVAGTNG